MFKEVSDYCSFNKAFINGEYVIASGSMECISPVDGSKVCELAVCDASDVEAAVASARKAFESGVWTDKTHNERKEILCKFADIIAREAETLAKLDSIGMGKCISGCRYNDVPLAVNCIKFFAESIDKVYDECVPPVPNALGTITREPLGVVGAITPWNYPMENVAWKIGPSLAAGNSLVLKPAEQSTLSAICIGKFAQEAGIPAGVLNVIPGYGNVTGKALALHNDVDGIFFTGSSVIGKKMYEYSSASNLKRVAVECGGKSPLILLHDCYDVKEAVDTLLKCVFINQGQTCTAPTRLIVEKDIHDEVIRYLLEGIDNFIPENPLDYNTKVGALVSEKQCLKVMDYIKSGIEQGADLICGGKRIFPVENGAYVEPTIFDNVSNDMVIAQEEIFGPVLSVITVNDAEEALKVANDSCYGLAASVWTADFNKAHYISKKLKAGFIHVNCYGEDNITAPFGGYKLSGNGSKDKALHAINDYTEIKTTWFKIKR